LKYDQIRGGQTVEESAKIFMTILEGNGTQAQNDVVTANAAMALYAGDRSKGLANCVTLAKETLASGKALQAFKKLIR
jgi:anthranilate phosphoribosyltransferase